MRISAVTPRIQSSYARTRNSTQNTSPAFQGTGKGAFLGASTGILATFFTGLLTDLFQFPLSVTGMLLFLGSFLGAAAGDAMEDKMNNSNKNK